MLKSKHLWDECWKYCRFAELKASFYNDVAGGHYSVSSPSPNSPAAHKAAAAQWLTPAGVPSEPLQR